MQFLILSVLAFTVFACAPSNSADQDSKPERDSPSLLSVEGSVLPAEFSADGRFLLTAANEARRSSLIVWHVETGREIARFTDHDVSALAIAPDGAAALLGRGDGSVSLVEVATGNEVRRYVGHEESIQAAAFSPDGVRALTGGRDRTMRVWDVATGRELHRCDHDGGVTSVRIAPGGAYAVTRSHLGTARSWSVESGLEASFEPEPRQVTAIAFSRDGRFVATAVAIGFRNIGPRGTPPSARRHTGPWNVHIHDIASGTRLIRCAAQREHVVALAMAPDSKSVLTGGSGGIAQLLTVASGLPSRRFDLNADEAESDGVLTEADVLDVLSVAFGGESERVFVLRHRRDRRYAVVVAGPGAEGMRRVEGLVSLPVISSDGRFVVTPEGERLPSMIEVSTGTRRRFQEQGGPNER